MNNLGSAVAILFFLQAAFRQPDPREAAERMLRKRMFVYGYFILFRNKIIEPTIIVFYTKQPDGFEVPVNDVNIRQPIDFQGR